MKRTGIVTLLAFTGALAMPTLAKACAVCFKDPEHPQTIGVNYAVLGLLAITVTVLAAFGGFFLQLRKRAKLYYQEHPLAGAAFEASFEERQDTDTDSRP